MQQNNEINVILVGERWMGKTALLARLKGEDFPSSSTTTTADNTHTPLIRQVDFIDENKTPASVTLTIWEMGWKNNEPYYPIARDKATVVLVTSGRYDSHIDFEKKLRSFFIKPATLFSKEQRVSHSIMLIRTKSDLSCNLADEGYGNWQLRGIARANSLVYGGECSAKTGENVKEVLQEIAGVAAKDWSYHSVIQLDTSNGSKRGIVARKDSKGSSFFKNLPAGGVVVGTGLLVAGVVVFFVASAMTGGILAAVGLGLLITSLCFCCSGGRSRHDNVVMTDNMPTVPF